MKKMNYSFIIPHHNSPELLSRCIESIPQRDDIEIIVVDDNSDVDKKPHITRPDVRLIFIDAEHTKGAGRARNYGLKVTTGKWIVFADADDLFAPDFLERFDEYKDRDNLDVIYYNAYSVDSDSLVANDRMNWEWEVFNRLNQEDKTTIMYHFHAPWYKMVNKQFITQYRIIFEEVPKGNDVLFTLLVAGLSQYVIFDKRKLYIHTYYPQSITHSHYSASQYLIFYAQRIKKNKFCLYKNVPVKSISFFRFNYRILKKEGFRKFLAVLNKIVTNWYRIYYDSNEYVEIYKVCKSKSN